MTLGVKPKILVLVINFTCSRPCQCLHLSHISLHVPTMHTSAMLPFFVSQTCQGHLSQGTLVLVVPTAWNSHDSPHSVASSSHSDIGLNSTLVIYITVES